MSFSKTWEELLRQDLISAEGAISNHPRFSEILSLFEVCMKSLASADICAAKEALALGLDVIRSNKDAVGDLHKIEKLFRQFLSDLDQEEFVRAITGRRENVEVRCSFCGDDIEISSQSGIVGLESAICRSCVRLFHQNQISLLNSNSVLICSFCRQNKPAMAISKISGLVTICVDCINVCYQHLHKSEVD
jgi:hypothetical protein